MNSIKNITLERIKNLPDDVTLEDLMYEINVIAQVLDGVRDAEEGRTLTEEELAVHVEKASSNLKAIHQFISKDSTVYANRFIKIIISKTQILKKYPYSGRMLPELREESIREIIYQNYRIVYRVTNKDAVTILAVPPR